MIIAPSGSQSAFLRKDRLIKAGLFILVLWLASVLRWYRLSETVLAGFDVWTYLRLVFEWTTHGMRPEGAFAKPGFIMLGVGAGKLLGVSDATLPFLNASLDVINVALVFGLARLAGLAFAPAVTAMCLYACLPAAVLEARSALTHIASLTFVLAAVSLLLLRHRLPLSRIACRYTLVFAASLMAGYAGLTHPTALLWPLLLPVLLVILHRKTLRQPWPLVEELLLYAAGVTTPFFAFALGVKSETLYGYKLLALWRSIFQHGQDAAYMKAGFEISLGKIDHYLGQMFFAHIITPPLVWLFALASAWAVMTATRLYRCGLHQRAIIFALYSDPPALVGLTTLGVLVLGLLIARLNGFEQWFMGDRFFLTLAPVAIMLGVAMLEAPARLLSNSWHNSIMIGVCLVGLAGFWHYFPQYLYTNPPFYKQLRKISRQQDIVVDAKDKVLVFPDAGRHPLTSDYYFSRQDFLTDAHPQNSADLTRFLATNHIRYILFSPVVYLGLTSQEGHPAVLAANDPKVREDLRHQIAFFQNYLEERQASPRLCFKQSWPPQDTDLRPVRLYAIGNHDYTAHLGNSRGRDNAFCLFDLEAKP
ncbi:hypothetical protein [Solidesulfovibrio sp. C21]|uniref:hypothetical protein n=1 Tax=Solidesulfovibrio sp. C21 TaxID=3398613 RepID=UPI0039FB9426